MTRRRKHEIIADILLVVRTQAKRTRIMYGANLNHKILLKYTSELEQLGLIEFKRDRNVFEITDSGIAYLNSYRGYAEIQSQLTSLLKNREIQTDKLLRLLASLREEKEFRKTSLRKTGGSSFPSEK